MARFSETSLRGKKSNNMYVRSLSVGLGGCWVVGVVWVGGACLVGVVVGGVWVAAGVWFRCFCWLSGWRFVSVVVLVGGVVW